MVCNTHLLVPICTPVVQYTPPFLQCIGWVSGGFGYQPSPQVPYMT